MTFLSILYELLTDRFACVVSSPFWHHPHSWWPAYSVASRTESSRLWCHNKRPWTYCHPLTHSLPPAAIWINKHIHIHTWLPPPCIADWQINWHYITRAANEGSDCEVILQPGFKLGCQWTTYCSIAILAKWWIKKVIHQKVNVWLESVAKHS